MSDSSKHKTSTTDEQRQRLWTGDNTRHKHHKPLYTHFVRWMRLILPLLAIAVIGLLFAWPRVEETMSPIREQAALPQTVGRNELLNPRFESRDDQNQPFVVIAQRAIQSSHNADVIILKKPRAEITLTGGTSLAAEADNGAYRQEDEKLVLEGHVKLFHNEGYQLNTEKMLVDLSSQKAWSDQPVSGSGPAGTLEASGMKADNGTEKLIFTGPITLILKQSVKGL